MTEEDVVRQRSSESLRNIFNGCWEVDLARGPRKDDPMGLILHSIPRDAAPDCVWLIVLIPGVGQREPSSGGDTLVV